MTELLRPCGIELARRWVAALLVVDEADREPMVATIEKRVVEIYGIARDYPQGERELQEVTVVHPPMQQPGYVEQVETTYARTAPRRADGDAGRGSGKKAPSKPRRRRA